MTLISLPPRPPAPRPPRISWAAFVTPVVMAGAMWLMTRSPYALAFAALGPMAALISLLDGRRGGARERRERLTERADELARIIGLVDAAHARERATLLRRAPGAAAALAASAGSVLWKGVGAQVSLGLGTLASAAVVTGEAVSPAELAIQRDAAALDAAPVLADAGAGIAVCGPAPFARAYLRGLIVQLYAALPPDRLEPPELVDSAGHAEREWEWVPALPHGGAAAAGIRPRFGVFADARLVPPGYHAVVTVVSPVHAIVELYGAPGGGDMHATERADIPAPLEPGVVPELVSRADAAAFCAVLAARAHRLGVGAAAHSLPADVAFADLPPGGGRGLAATIGRSLDGLVRVDLVSDGPHAIVGGVTGAGKSELLVSWVAGLTFARSSDELVVLLVDFKGGTAFQPLAVLPHVVGVVTDLSHGEAGRALSSLSSELRRREAELARVGARDVAETELPRLVIVVDEFAAMLDAFPEFSALFTDIAARGRALGVHLILATQRPTGVMREALAANCPLRLSLRMHSAEDSRWVVGSDAAARLSAATPGRCVVAVDGACTEVQIARTTRADLADLARNAPAAPPPRRPWLDPLPALLTRAALPEGSGSEVVGIADLPDEQRRALVRFTTTEAPLALLGAARSGKTSTLRTLTAASGLDAIVVSAEREHAWDAVEAALEQCEAAEADARPVLLAIDDADAVCARLGDDYAATWCERLGRVLRDGPLVGVHTVLAAQRPTGPLREVLALARETVLLRQASKQEHVLAGAPAALWDDALPAGAGLWRGRRVQFLAPAPRLETVDGRPVRQTGEPPVDIPLVPARGTATLVVTRTAGRLASRARAAGLPAAAFVDLGAPAGYNDPSPEALLADPSLPTGVLIVGDPDAWLGRWPLFAALRARHPVVFLGCEASDVRALTRSRALPPPLSPGPGAGWVMRADGGTRRCRLEAA